MSRRVVANLVGRSEEWLRQVERGQRKLDSIEVLQHLARVLHIDDLSDFLGWDNTTTITSGKSSLAGALRDVLTDSPLPGSSPSSGPITPHSLPHLASELSEAWELWQRSPQRYLRLDTLLPRLLRRLQSAWRAGDRESGLVTLLVRALGLARYYAHNVRDEHLAWIAAEQCLVVATASADAVRQGAATVHRAASMRAMHYTEKAQKLATDAAQCLVESDQRPIRGALLLEAAEAAAETNQRYEADRLLDLARAEALELGSDNTTEFVLFGTAEVGIREVRMALRLGRITSALQLGRDLPLPPDLAIGRRASHLITMAYAYTSVRDDVAAVFALNQVAKLSPEDLWLSELARSAIRRLAHRQHVLIADDVSRLSSLAKVS